MLGEVEDSKMTALAVLEQDPSHHHMERYPVGVGVLGRFLSRDPIGHAGNLNLYAYPTNPVNAADPSGLEWIPLSVYKRDTQRQAELRKASGCKMDPLMVGAIGTLALIPFAGPGATYPGIALRVLVGGTAGGYAVAKGGGYLAAYRGIPERQIATGLSYFPESQRSQGKEILDYFQEIYPDVTDAKCGDAAAEVERRLDKKFGNDPRFKAYEFEFHTEYVKRIPMNMAVVKFDGKPIVGLYAGSDLGGGPNHAIWKP